MPGSAPEVKSDGLQGQAFQGRVRALCYAQECALLGNALRIDRRRRLFDAGPEAARELFPSPAQACFVQLRLGSSLLGVKERLAPPRGKGSGAVLGAIVQTRPDAFLEQESGWRRRATRARAWRQPADLRLVSEDASKINLAGTLVVLITACGRAAIRKSEDGAA